MKNYKVIANDDAMKYQVIDTSNNGNIVYENDGEYEAEEICSLMNEAYQEGRRSK